MSTNGLKNNIACTAGLVVCTPRLRVVLMCQSDSRQYADVRSVVLYLNS